MSHKGVWACLSIAVTAMAASAAFGEEGESKVITKGSRVSIEYTLKLADGTVADTNVGGEPLVYEQGGGMILPALEEALAGLKVNDTRSLTLPPEKGYGAVDPEAFETVPAERIPEEARKVGAQLVSEDAAGNRFPVRVHEVKGDQIVLDLNHPLAGQTLFFEIRILAID